MVGPLAHLLRFIKLLTRAADKVIHLLSVITVFKKNRLKPLINLFSHSCITVQNIWWTDLPFF